MSAAADLEAVLARVAALEAQLAAAEAAKRPEPLYTRPTFADRVADPAITAVRKLYELRGAELPQSYRELRQLAAAVAVAQGEPVPGAVVPSGYAKPMRAIYVARQKGMSWRAALVECGFELPAEAAIAERARALYDELPGLWEALRPVIGLLRERGTAVAGGIALERVGRLMT